MDATKKSSIKYGVAMREEKECQTIYRVSKNKNNPYVQINKTCLRDKRLSWKSKGLLAYMLSLPDNWVIYNKELVNHSCDGMDSLKSAIKELKQYGYLKREREREADGTFGRWVTTVFEEPHVECEDSPKVENPPLEKPTVENPHLLIKNNTNELINNNNSETESNMNNKENVTSNFVVVDNDLVNRIHYMGVADAVVHKWINTYGEQYILEKVLLTESQRPKSPASFLNRAIIEDWKAALTRDKQGERGLIEKTYPTHEDNVSWYNSLNVTEKMKYLQVAFSTFPEFETHLKHQQADPLDARFFEHSLFKMMMSILRRSKN